MAVAIDLLQPGFSHFCHMASPHKDAFCMGEKVCQVKNQEKLAMKAQLLLCLGIPGPMGKVLLLESALSLSLSFKGTGCTVTIEVWANMERL